VSDRAGAHTVGVANSDRPVIRAHRLVLAAWILAGVILIALAVAVIRYLAAGGSGASSGPAAMHMSGAFYRGGAASTLRRPFSAALFTAWQLDAVAVAILTIAAAAYLTAVCLVPVRSDGLRWSRWRTASFLAGLAVCALATNASIAVYDQVLFSAHMIGHLALVMVAPALIVTGRPMRLLLMASRPSVRERLRRVLTGRVVSVLTAPPVALASYAVAIVGTHLTGLMDHIMQITWAGQLEHLVYLVVGCQFFVLILGDEPIRWRLSAPARWLLLAIAMAVDTFTGVILIQASSPIAMVSAPHLSIDALADTHTGGAIMWVGGDALMALVMVVLVVSWLYRPAQRSADRDGWAERARRATFETNTGHVTTAADADIDDSEGADAARRAYNEWLANLARR
jgi:cytochrome c oxidase assembly factor CtaG